MSMRPSGMLMIEHRLIERFIKVIADKLEKGGSLDPLFVDTAVDFFRTYADRTHHGKEEDILFLELAKLKLDPAQARIMAELIDEHKTARKHVGRIVELNEKYRKGDASAVAGIIETLKTLMKFYPVHIKKEDAVFFPAVMKYYSKEELGKMLDAFNEFDRKMIHEKYIKVVERCEGK